MRLSYSLLEHFQTCEFRTKVLDFERCKPAGTNASDAFRALIGQLAHAGQAAVLEKKPVRWSVVHKFRDHKDGLPEGWDADRVIDRACGMVTRWETGVPGWSSEDVQPVHVDSRLVWKLPSPVGIFDEVVIVPDLVGLGRHPGGPWGALRLYDWKWVGQLDGETDDSGYRYDLQSAIYQYVLDHGFGLDVRYHGIVQGLIEEPTPFRVNKDGTVSTRAARNSWEEYVRVCEAAGHAPDEIMRDRCRPMFKHHLNYRSRKEVDAIWEQTVVPLTLKVSAAARAGRPYGSYSPGFVRRMSKFTCGRCPVREECQLGQLGQHADRAWNSIYLEG